MAMLVFEGIDGAGAETQAKKFCEYLKEKGVPYLYLEYPDYSNPIGNLIKEILYGKYKFNPITFSLLFIADFAKDIEKINQALEEGKIVVLNRYFTSTLAYESVLGVNLENLLEIANNVGLIKPDLVIYIDITPEEAIKRKYKEKDGKIDEHEKNKAFLGKVREKYLYLVENQVWTKWIKINGMQSIDEVFKDIVEVISKNKYVE